MPHLGNMGAATATYPEGMVDKFAGQRLIICAGGHTVWSDLKSIPMTPSEQNDSWHVMCINDIVMHYPGRIDHFYSNDHRWMPRWLDARRELLVKAFGPVRHTHSCNSGAKYNWPWPGHGTSTLNAAYTGVAMGYDPIVICGAPLDDGPHYFDPWWQKTNFLREVSDQLHGQLQYWSSARLQHFDNKVYAQSGRTKALLGSWPHRDKSDTIAEN